MKKRQIIVMLCFIVMVCGLFSSCANTKTDSEVSNTEIQIQNTEDIVQTENTVQTENAPISIYEEKDYYFVVKNNTDADTTLVDGETLRRVGDVVDKTITLTDSVDIYTAQKSKVGYTKIDIECYYECVMGEWSFVIFNEGGFYVLTEELLSVADGFETEEEINDEVINEVNIETLPKEDNDSTYTVTDMTKTMYAKQSVNLRSGPSTDYEKIGSLTTNQEVTVTGLADTGWYRIDYNGGVAFVSNNYLSDTKVEITPPDDGGNTNEDENDREEEYTPPTDDDTDDDFWDIVFPEDPEPIYTVDEVISIVRSVLESGGMKWYPDVYPNSEDPTGGMSWGMDWVPMDDPQTYAESLLRGFQYQGFDVYYLEYQYVENNKVVFKTYFSFIPK